ncbi:MAG: DUF1572 domain-containing protein [Thermoanaerobaculia bacterium]|nr:DUF1572 domain-containing protein [Thermoanaerobaculia bacterium]
MDPTALARHYLEDVVLSFRKQRELAERALAQVDDAAFFRRLDAESNSLAIVVQHVAGNQRSRWRDFLASDGEKPDRRRDDEFELAPGASRGELMARWEEGWRLLFDALAALAPGDLLRTVTIRGEPHTVLQAIDRQLVHYAQHVGQIVLLAKHWAGPAWRTLSIPKGRSRDFEVARDGVVYLPEPER